jgi:peptidoglycan/xylan/chitin deacetylase (PgdA/CDA1 family)
MLRIDRLLTLHFFKHLAKIYPQTEGIRIPILMYHSISDEPEKGHPYFWINTSPKVFAEHMQFLHDNNYKVISLSEAVRLIESSSLNSVVSDNKAKIGPRSLHATPFTLNSDKFVVLTFDDGYRDFYTEAFPVLQQYGFTATVFLPTSFIDTGKKLGLKGKEHLNWAEVVELEREGITFGSHTVTHPQLSFLKRNQIESEVKESKGIIEDKIGKSIESFSYPFAFLEDREFKKFLGETLERAGYNNGVSTRIGTVTNGEDRFFLKRIPVNSFDDMPLFKAKLDGLYDWLNIPQYFLKKLKIGWVIKGIKN